MTNLEILKQQTADMEAKIKEMKAEIERMENGWEMKCPYREGDRFYLVNPRGSVKFVFWDNCVSNKKSFNQGNIFPTRKAAELESKRRNLLTRFKAFRNECNGDWKPDWKNVYENKYFICKVDSKLGAYASSIGNSFAMFGYFKNSEDCERAIKLFGDEIIELYVEGE